MISEFKNKKIRLFIIESQEIIRLGLCKFAENQPSLDVVALTDNLNDAFELVIINKPDVILLDLLLINNDSIEFVPKILTACPTSSILAFSCNQDTQSHLDVLRSGVVGIFSKHHSIELLLKAIHAVAVGEVWFDKRITKLLHQAQTNQIPITADTDYANKQQQSMTERECNIACLAAQGLPAKKIGEQLFISDKTVRNRLTVIYEKFDVTNQVELCIKLNQLSCRSSADQPRNPENCPCKKG